MSDTPEKHPEDIPLKEYLQQEHPEMLQILQNKKDIEDAAKAVDDFRMATIAAEVQTARGEELAAAMEQTIDEETREKMREMVKVMTESARSIIESQWFQSLRGVVNEWVQRLEKMEPQLVALGEWAERQKDFFPFLNEEMERLQAERPELASATMADLLDGENKELGRLYKEAVERAEKRYAEFREAKGAVDLIESIPSIIANPADILEYPLDKPNAIIWNLLALTAPNQIIMDIDTAKETDRKKGTEALIYCTINFEETEGLRITKQLTPFDKRVYIAIAALFNAGNQVVSIRQIHRAMGSTGEPSDNQVEKINNSLDKMRGARLYIDSRPEHDVYTGYPKFVYDGALLEFRRISAYINNTAVESAIRILAEPPMISFAKGRKQVTTISRALLESPLSKTEANLIIDDYLIEQIAHMKKNKSFSRKMLFDTICKNCKITDRKQRQRAKSKITYYLNHYEDCGWIRGYEWETDGITIKI